MSSEPQTEKIAEEHFKDGLAFSKLGDDRRTFESYKKDPLLPYASSVHIIELIGLVVSGWLMFRSLIVSSDMLKKSDDPFYQHKIDSCLFFSTNLLTKTQSLKRLVIEGSEAIILPKVSNL